MNVMTSADNTTQRVLAGLLLCSVAAIACNLGAGDGGGSVPTGDQVPAGPAASQPTGPFRAVATSAISVDLSWDPVEGATGYRIENQFGDSEWFVLAELSGDQLAYEDFLAPSNTALNYRLTPLIGTDAGKALTTSATTPEVVPNPYRVVAKLEEPDYSDIGLDIPGFDPETFDPSTFDPSTFDFSAISPENLDLSSLGPKPVSAMGRIGPEGGSVSVTGRNGVIYTLEVSPDGLAFPVLFLLTPIAEIEGYPFSEGWQAAVDIQPAGIYFDIPATVTFQVPVDESSGTQGDPGVTHIGFAFDRGGGEFHLVPIEDQGVSETRFLGSTAKLAAPAWTAPRTEADSSVQLQTMTLKLVSVEEIRTGPAGVGEFTLTLGEVTEITDFTKENPPTRPSDQAASRAAAEDLAKKADSARAERAAEALRLKLSQGDVQQFADALLADFAAFFESSLYKMLSVESQSKLRESAAENLLKHLQNTEYPCPSPEAAAMQDLVRRMMNPKTSFEKWMAIVVFDRAKNLLEAHAAARSCKLELIVWSEASISDEQCKAELFVRAEVPLTWHLDGKAFLQGSDQLTYDPVKVGQGFNPEDTVCEEYKFENLDRSMILVTYLHPVFTVSGQWTLTDWTMKKEGTGGLSGYGEVTKVIRQLLYLGDPPERVRFQGAPRAGFADPWGGIISLVGTQTQVWPGASNWRLNDPQNPIIAEWDLRRSAQASGEGYRVEHRTILSLVTAD